MIGGSYMRKKLCNYVIIPLFVFIVVVFSGGKNVDAASNVRINSSNFPDVNFRKRIQVYDKNHDGSLSKSEINKVKKLDLRNTKHKKHMKNITNYKGIEYFSNLRSFICGDYDSDSRRPKGALDLSRNKKLEYVSIREQPFTSYIKEVKLTNCRKLKELYISNGSTVEKLDLKGCTNLTKIFIMDDNRLKSLDVSSCRKLKELDICEARKLTKVKLGEINKLEILDIAICPSLKNINIKNQTNLKSLSLSKTAIKNLDLKNKKQLTGLNLQETPTTSLDLSNQKNLRWIAIRKTKLNQLDLSQTLITRAKVASDVDYYCYVYDKNVEIVFADGEKIMSPFDRDMSVK